MYGLRDIEEIMSDDECNEDDAQIIFEEERESWLDYTAAPFSKELEEKAKAYHYHNPYKDITDNLST